MTKAKVYFSDMRTRYGGLSLPQKLGKLIEAAGIGDIDFQNKFAAIKIHFGEPGNLSFLRPNYAKVVVDTVAAQGGRPFLTDCNTLYVGVVVSMRWSILQLLTKMVSVLFQQAVTLLLPTA